jgi:CRP-like cAMP-binding protein
MKRPRAFGPLTEDRLRVEISGPRVRRFATGEIVFHEGDLAGSTQLVLRGRFAVRASTPSGETAILAILGEGEFLGVIELLREDPHRTTTVVALEPAETLSITREQFESLRRRNESASDVLLSMMADDVARYCRHLLEALYAPAALRVLRRLLEAAEAYGEDDIRLTQTQLAQLAGASRTTVSNVLRQETKLGTVHLGRARISIVDRRHIERRIGPGRNATGSR